MKRNVLVKVLLTEIILTVFSTAFSAPGVTQKYIMVDQFGYRTQDKKLAVIVDPIVGFNAADEFIPGNIYEVRKWNTDETVYTGSPVSYDNLKTQASSGDRGWWFDFSTVTQPGEYYIYDLENEAGSYRFKIDNYVYRDVLKAAVRMFYYQRLNSPKEEPYAEPEWIDAAAFMGPKQDTECHAVWDKTNESLVRDLSGGWMDAGDVNKYVTFAENAVHQLLLAYEINPNAFPDDYNIPESGNGIPDIIDEIKYEVDWLKKMQDTIDGGVFIKMGEIDYNGKSPLSSDTRPRYYGPKCSSSSIAAAGMFAHAAIVFSGFPDLVDYARDLSIRAELAYQWYETNDKSANCDNGEIKSGDADRSLAGQEQMKVVAAVYLFGLTGKEEYNAVVKNGYKTLQPFVEPFWTLKSASHGDALMYYITLPGADPIVVQTIRNKRTTEGRGSEFYFNNNDLYDAYMPDWAYWWGSNGNKANVGTMNYDYINYNIDEANHSRFKDHALGILHYFHGLNPFNLVYLSNMGDYGAEKSCDEIYHTWFKEGTKWDNAVTGVGPAPGYLPGGVNIYDDPDLPIKVGNTVFPARLPDQPNLKMYSELNNGDRPWTITEPAIYYQASYIYLLSNFTGPDCDTSAQVVAVSFETDTFSLQVGYEDFISAEVMPENVCNQFVYYTISDTSIAEVNDQGKVIAKEQGIAYIIAIANADTSLKDTLIIKTLPCIRQPYGESATIIPGVVEAEKYDIGCNDAYFDSDLPNNGGQYRSDAVDIEACSEGGFNIGWVEPGEWLEYTIDVSETGTYAIAARVASAENTGKFVLSFKETEVVTDTFMVSNSGSAGWQDWKYIVQNGTELTEGEYIMRVTMASSGFNLNYLQFIEGDILPPEAPASLMVEEIEESLHLSWEDNAEDETGYIIERKSTAAFSVIDTVDADVTDYIDTDIVKETNYTYRVYPYHTYLNGEYSNEASGLIVGMIKNKNYGINVYPNPSNGSFYIRFENNVKESGFLEIIDITGKVLYESIIEPAKQTHLDLTLKPGIYFIKLNTNTESFYERIMVN